MNNLNWERLRVFEALLDAGSMSAAARKLSLSQPTVSRQVRALEADMNTRLVEVTSDGVVPTHAGLAMLPALQEMIRAAGSIDAMLDGAAEVQTVRVTCGPWMAAFLSRNLDSLIKDPPDYILEVVGDIAFANMPRREADIAIRNQKPAGAGLKIDRLPDYAFAAYGSVRLVRNRKHAYDADLFEKFDWGALTTEFEDFPSARMLASRLKKNPIARFGTSTCLLDAVRSGRILALLPCFAAESERGLVRVSPPEIPDYGGHWIAVPEDLRWRPHVRSALNCIEELFQENRELLIPTD